MKRQKAGRVLPFRSAEAMAKLAAEARLVELLTEVDEIEAWISDAEDRQRAWALNYSPHRQPLALVKR